MPTNGCFDDLEWANKGKIIAAECVGWHGLPDQDTSEKHSRQRTTEPGDESDNKDEDVDIKISLRETCLPNTIQTHARRLNILQFAG